MLLVHMLALSFNHQFECTPKNAKNTNVFMAAEVVSVFGVYLPLGCYRVSLEQSLLCRQLVSTLWWLHTDDVAWRPDTSHRMFCCY